MAVTVAAMTDQVMGNDALPSHCVPATFAVGNFEYWPFDRWKNEPDRDHAMRAFHNDLFVYSHVWAFPRYLLRFSIQMSMA